MDNCKEMDFWDENEVQIEDLATPEHGFSLFLFSVGKKWQSLARPHTTLVPLICTVCLLSILLPGSALMSWAAQAPHPASAASQQHRNCYFIAISSTAIDPTTSRIRRSTSDPQPGTPTVHVCNAFYFHIENVYASPAPSGNHPPQP